MPEIRRSSLDDLDALVPLFDGYRRFYGQAADLDGARAFLEARLRHDESIVLLATLDGRPAGFTQLFPLFSSVAMTRVYLLNDLYVAEHARRSGVAGALLDAARDVALAEGATRLVLETAADNFPAQALYRGAGWTQEHSLWFRLSLGAAA